MFAEDEDMMRGLRAFGGGEEILQDVINFLSFVHGKIRHYHTLIITEHDKGDKVF